MYLYCRCRYPLLVTAVWKGNDYHLVLHDSASTPAKERPPITTCPNCRQTLVVRELDQHPPPTTQLS